MSTGGLIVPLRLLILPNATILFGQRRSFVLLGNYLREQFDYLVHVFSK